MPWRMRKVRGVVRFAAFFLALTRPVRGLVAGMLGFALGWVYALVLAMVLLVVVGGSARR
jgi:hypothetical protein